MKKIVLFDMDDTLCDYRGQLIKDIERKLDTEIAKNTNPFNERLSPRIRDVIKEIRQEKGWWTKIPPIPSGLELWHYFGLIGFERHILTKAPFKKEDSNGWSEKFEWYKTFLPEAKNITETLNKEYVFGDVIVDDWTPYITPWLKRWKSSTAIIPTLNYNKNFKHKRAIHYNTKNFNKIENFLQENKLL